MADCQRLPSVAETAHAPELSPTDRESQSARRQESTNRLQTRENDPVESRRKAPVPAESAPPTNRTRAPSAIPTGITDCPTAALSRKNNPAAHPRRAAVS